MQTPENEYALIFQGQVAPGWDVAEVKERFTALMASSPEKTEELFSGRRLIFKRFASEEAAEEAAERFRQIGMVLEIQAVAAKPAAQAAPSAAVRAAAKPAPAVREMMTVAQAPPKRGPAAATERQVPFVFSGSGSEFFKIWIVNVFLTILTVGIYSAWAKVRTLRYFYGNTSLDGSAFEYLADPIKILKGRLIVLAVFLVNFVVSKLFPWISPLFGLFILILMPWVIRQTLRFRLHYTAWRGVRFAFAGTLWDAAKAFIFWPLLPFAGAGIIALFASLGVKTFSSSTAMIVLMSILGFLLLLAFMLITIPVPWHRQTHYLVDNSRFGAASFENHSTPRDFFKIFVIMFGIFLGIVLVMSLVGGILVFATGYNQTKGPGILSSVLGIVMYLIIISILSAWYKVKITNLRVGKTNIGPHRLVSSYATGSYLGLFITNTLAVIFTLSLFYPFAKARTARYAAEHTAIIIDGDLDGFVADQQAEVSAVGSETGDFLDIDIGF